MCSNLICISCGGTMHRCVVTKNVAIEGFSFSPMKIPNLTIYRCNTCGKSVLPESSKKRLQKIKQDLFPGESEGAGPVV
jgi:hypothetical protein